MLKNRLAKLEQSINQQQNENKIYLVYEDKYKGRMSIPDLNFYGTIESGHTRMDQYPSGIFVIWHMTMDRNYEDEEWRRLVENMAN